MDNIDGGQEARIDNAYKSVAWHLRKEGYGETAEALEAIRLEQKAQKLQAGEDHA